MIWFIDFDACLCDNQDAFVERCAIWLDNNHIAHTAPDVNVFHFGKMFGVDNYLHEDCYESKEFAGYYIQPPKEGAIEFLSSIDKKQDMIAILTSRRPDLRIPVTEEIREFLGDTLVGRHTIALSVLTKLWLERYVIPFDNIIYREDKVSFMKEFPTGIAIEDNPIVINGYIDNGIKFIRMNYPHNEGCEGLVADTWFDIDKMHRLNII